MKKKLSVLLSFFSLIFFAQNYSVELFTDQNSGLLGQDVLHVEADSQNAIWFATNYNQEGSGLGKFKNNQWTYYNVTNSPIASNFLIDIKVNNGNVYAAHFHAISKFDGTNWTIFDSSDHLMFNSYIQNFLVMDNGEMWVLFNDINQYDHYFLGHYNGSEWQILDSPTIPGLSGVNFTMVKDELGRLFITQSSTYELIIYDGNWSVKTLPAPGGAGMAVKNNIFYANDGGSIYTLNLATNQINDISGNCSTGNCHVTDMAFDPSGKLWLSESTECAEGSIFMLSDCLIFKHSTYNTFPTGSIWDISIDGLGNVWGTNFNGIIKISNSGSLGVGSSVYNKDFAVYPNPAEDFITFKSSRKVVNAEVFDAVGKLIQKNSVDSSQKIKLNALAGIYFIKAVFSDGHSATVQIIKK